VVAEHVHEPPAQLGVGCAQGAWFVQVPTVLHVCGVLPEQLV
jgi:hypothetical protein